MPRPLWQGSTCHWHPCLEVWLVTRWAETIGRGWAGSWEPSLPWSFPKKTEGSVHTHGVLRVGASIWVLILRPLSSGMAHTSQCQLMLFWSLSFRLVLESCSTQRHATPSPQAGPPVCKPDVISHLERGEEPWQVPREVPGGAHPGERGTQWNDVESLSLASLPTTPCGPPIMASFFFHSPPPQLHLHLLSAPSRILRIPFLRSAHLLSTDCVPETAWKTEGKQAKTSAFCWQETEAISTCIEIFNKW